MILFAQIVTHLYFATIIHFLQRCRTWRCWSKVMISTQVLLIIGSIEGHPRSSRCHITMSQVNIVMLQAAVWIREVAATVDVNSSTISCLIVRSPQKITAQVAGIVLLAAANVSDCLLPLLLISFRRRCNGWVEVASSSFTHQPISHMPTKDVSQHPSWSEPSLAASAWPPKISYPYSCWSVWFEKKWREPGLLSSQMKHVFPSIMKTVVSSVSDIMLASPLDDVNVVCRVVLVQL